MRQILYQVVVNNSWAWLEVEERPWYFAPTERLKDAEAMAGDMISRAIARHEEVGVACCIPGRSGAGLSDRENQKPHQPL